MKSDEQKKGTNEDKQGEALMWSNAIRKNTIWRSSVVTAVELTGELKRREERTLRVRIRRGARIWRALFVHKRARDAHTRTAKMAAAAASAEKKFAMH